MYQTHAIVLTSQESGEHDSFVSFFTQEFGKIRVKVRGAKKHTTKQGTFLDSFSLLHICFVFGKYSPILTSVSQAQCFCNIQNSLYALGYVQSFLELVDNVVYEHQKDLHIWELLKSVLVGTNADTHQDLWSAEKKWLLSLLYILGSAFPNNRVSYKKNILLDKDIRVALEQVSNTHISFFGYERSKNAQ